MALFIMPPKSVNEILIRCDNVRADHLNFSRRQNSSLWYFFKSLNIMLVVLTVDFVDELLKDVARYCHCAYILRISRYSGFLWVVPANTGIFLRRLKLRRESRT